MRPTAPGPGQRLGRYELVARIGTGGWGEVWEAVLHGPAGFRKRLALKFLSDEERPPDTLLREARLGGLLQHPNLVEVYALEQIDGRWVCAMELVEGGSLLGHLPLSPRAVVEVGLQVCAGLAHAHETIGLVHLDLKPDNLLVGVNGVKVADLGISRAHGFAPEAGLPGTPGYMAPEYLRGEGVDARADIYALGMVLIHLALGVPLQHPDAVDWLAPVTRRCLADDPNQRFRNMRELAEALSALAVEGSGLADLLGRADWAPGTLGTRSTAGSGGAETFLFDRARPATNLAEATESFFGRADELTALIARLRHPGLTTLKGTGGLGKTRLAREAALGWHRLEHQPTWFVDLQAARTQNGLLSALADVLEVPLGAQEPAAQVDLLGHALRSRGPMAVVLDNFEQLLPWASAVGRWTELAPELRVLVTSREPLRLPTETVVELGPLSTEDAVALLVDRARAHGRDITGDPVLPELAERLDGLPLALELAAGRLGLLAPSQVLDRLEQRFRLLKDRSPRTARQQTLRAALDWSWDLLTDVERAALSQSAVFVGSFTADAAEAVWELPEDTWVLDVLQSLLDRSLIAGRPGGRFALFESTRAYAAERLESAQGARDRHQAFYARNGTRTAIQSLRARNGHLRRTALRDDLPNLVAAAEHTGAKQVDAAWAAWAVLELAGPWTAAAALSRVLPGPRGALLRGITHHLIGDADSARVALIEALEDATDPVDRADTLRALGRMDHERGRLTEAEERFSEALELHRAADNPSGAATLLCNLAVCRKQQDRFTEARAYYNEALAIYRDLGGLRGEAATITSIAALNRDADRHQEAIRGLERAIQLARRCGDRRIESVATGNLGVLALDVGDVDRARSLLEETLVHRREVGDRRGEGVLTATLGKVHSDLEQFDAARQLFVQAIAIHTEVEADVWRGIAEGYLGQMEFEASGPEVAIPWMRKAATRLRGGHEQMLGAILCTLTEAEGMVGDNDAAEATLAELMGIVTHSERVRGRAHAHASLSRLRARQGRLDEAREALDHAIAVEADAGLGPDSRLRVDIDESRRLLDELSPDSDAP